MLKILILEKEIEFPGLRILKRFLIHPKETL